MTVQDLIDKLNSLPEDAKKLEIMHCSEGECEPIYNIFQVEVINNPYYERKTFPDDDSTPLYITANHFKRIKKDIMKDDIIYECENDKFEQQKEKKAIVIT